MTKPKSPADVIADFLPHGTAHPNPRVQAQDLVNALERNGYVVISHSREVGRGFALLLAILFVAIAIGLAGSWVTAFAFLGIVFAITGLCRWQA